MKGRLVESRPGHERDYCGPQWSVLVRGPQETIVSLGTANFIKAYGEGEREARPG